MCVLQLCFTGVFTLVFYRCVHTCVLQVFGTGDLRRGGEFPLRPVWLSVTSHGYLMGLTDFCSWWSLLTGLRKLICRT